MKDSVLLYHSFLFRCWVERPAQAEQPAVWRFSLQNVRTGEQVGFTSVEAVLAYLQTRLNGRSVPSKIEDIHNP